MTTLLTLDAGTSGLKCSLFSPDGTLLGAFVSDYPVSYPREGWAEQDANDFVRAAVESVNALGESCDLSGVCAIGLSGTMNGCVPLDENGVPLYPNMIHLDTRATREVDFLMNAMGLHTYYGITGNRPDVHYGLPKLMWLKEHENDVYRRAKTCVNTKDILYGFLTGIRGRSDASDASLFGAYNVNTRMWDDEVLRAAGIDREKLPEIRPSTDVSGLLCPEAARVLGLKSGIPVAIGAGDGACTTHGSGVFGENGAYLTVGSSAWICGLSRSPLPDAEARAFHYADMDERFTNVCGTVACAAAAFDYMMKNVFDVTDSEGNIDFAEAEALCAESVPGAHGLFFLPTLMGERCPWWDASARGMLAGLTLTHTRADMARAAYEGIAQALHNCGDVLLDNGMEFRDLVLSGGGVKSGVWPQMFADVFNLPARVHANPREATSLGAAIAAGVGVGLFSSFEEASKMVKTGASFSPDPERAKAYRAHTRVYRALYGQMKEAMHAISAYQSETV